MDAAMRNEAVSILEAGKDLTVATLRADGGPQATTVSYASEGLTIYFGCDARSQKAQNLARDDRVSVTVNLPYGHWNEIRGLSAGGRAHRITDPRETARVGSLFLKKFSPEIEAYLSPNGGELALFRLEPQVISLLDYRQGFGHTDLVRVDEFIGA